MITISCVIFNKINYCQDIYTSQRLSYVHKIFVLLLFTLPTFVINDEVDNITVLELDANYSTYNDSYENFTAFNQNVTDYDISNKTSDVATELESTISVTEDSDSSFQSESNRKLFLFLTPDEDICNCDLTSNVCDINCCCDPDCDEEDMQVFSECSHQVLTPDESYCYQKDIILKNNTVYKMVKNSKNGMFCIVHDNFKHRLRFKDMPILKSHRDLITVLKYKYRTTYSWDTELEYLLDSSELRAGNPIYIDIKSDKKTLTSRWSLPTSCLSDLCSCKEDVTYLRDFKSSCSYVIGDLKTHCETMEVLSGDHVSDFCVSPRSSGGGSSTSLADLVVHTKMVGSNASDDAEDQSAQSAVCVGNNPKRPKWRDLGCDDVVRGVHFTIKQDGTGGITGIAVEFRYHNVSSGRTAVTQDYSVRFVWNNATDSERKSGNPGYQVGLPILASTNGSDVGLDEGMTRTFGLGVLEGDVQGFCAPSSIRRAIKFGKNLKTGCVLKRDNLAGCKALQESVSDVLLGASRRQVSVGVFGNANSSNPDDWTEVFHEVTDPPDSSDENCFVSLGLKIDLVHAAVGTVANPQHKIVGVGYRHEKPERVDLACYPQCRGVTLSTSVSFFDVTLPAVEHYAKVPSIKANLPSDFFYPFLYSGCSKSGSLWRLVCALLPWWICLTAMRRNL